jgi:hypothetical protein
VRRSNRAHESGIFRGCCLGLIVLLALIGAAAFVVDRALAAPELGASPGGPSHGTSEVAIAVALGAQLVAELASNPHGMVVLSEQDLSVIAAQNNPHPDRFHGLVARVRNGDVAVSALTNEGPLTVTAVAYVAIALDTTQSPPMFNVSLSRIDVGALTLPGWLRDQIVGNLSPSVALNQLFDSNAGLQALKANIECVMAASNGLRIGVHRPGVAADTAVCAG